MEDASIVAAASFSCIPLVREPGTAGHSCARRSETETEMPMPEVFVPTASSTMLGGRTTRFDQKTDRLYMRKSVE
jgi:hypothetical protein